MNLFRKKRQPASVSELASLVNEFRTKFDELKTLDARLREEGISVTVRSLSGGSYYFGGLKLLRIKREITETF